MEAIESVGKNRISRLIFQPKGFPPPMDVIRQRIRLEMQGFVYPICINDLGIAILHLEPHFTVFANDMLCSSWIQSLSFEGRFLETRFFGIIDPKNNFRIGSNFAGNIYTSYG